MLGLGHFLLLVEGCKIPCCCVPSVQRSQTSLLSILFPPLGLLRFSLALSLGFKVILSGADQEKSGLWHIVQTGSLFHGLQAQGDVSPIIPLL